MNNNFGISDRTYHELLQTISSFPQVERAILFGSRAKGNYNSGSDIDVAITGAEVTAELALTISAELNEKKPLPYFFDVLSFEAIRSAGLRDHIEKLGIVFFTRTGSLSNKQAG